MTKHVHKSLAELSSKSESVSWDSEVPGLGLRTRGDKITWIIQTRVEGRSRKKSIGSAEITSRDQARLEASALINSWTSSEDANTQPCTVAEFADRYISDCTGQWKPATLKAHRADIKNRIVPTFGRTDLRKITRNDVVSWMANLDSPQTTKNRALAVFSGMLRHSELLGYREPDSNPCKGLRRHKSGFEARYLTDEEWGRLGANLNLFEEQETEVVALIRFLALTGCRRSEGRLLKWEMIEGKRAVLPDAKAGPKAIWLGKPARDVLAVRPRNYSFVFAHHERPLSNAQIDKTWYAIRNHAGLDDLRIHDLRHGFASVAVNANIGLRTVAGLLGHADLETTAGYAHLAEKPVKDAANRVSSRLNKSLTGTKGSAISVELVERFLKSKIGILKFCKSETLDARAFQKCVIERHKPKKGGKI